MRNAIVNWTLIFRAEYKMFLLFEFDEKSMKKKNAEGHNLLSVILNWSYLFLLKFYAQIDVPVHKFILLNLNFFSFIL